jgi:tetratricopeptide (TPR) repeat protein
VAGLATLSNWQYSQAEAYFEKAIDIDPEAPLPRLGLGLAYIRQGQIAAGTWEIERAVAHDPKRAALRNWLGRGYFEEHLSKKASEEFELAQSDDPEDPTSYLFSALERYSANQPIEALRELQEAEKYPEARNVLRSQAGLYEDIATVGTALGRIYDTLEFDQLAISEGTKAVETAPANPGAHRFLMDAYTNRPGYEIARTSELLVSQLLSPPSKTPVQPNLAETNLALLDTTGPSRVTFAEFAPLFDSDGLRFDASGMVGTQETVSGEASLTGLYRAASLSVGQFYYEDDGYRENNDIQHRIFNAVSTIALSPEFSLFGEYRLRTTETGDRTLNFDIDTFDPFLRLDIEREVARLGAHAQLSRNSDLIAVYTRATLENDLFNQGFFGEDIRISAKDASNSSQLQYIYQGQNIRNVTGAAYTTNDVKAVSDFGGFVFSDSFDVSAWNTYSYFYLDIPEWMTWTIGGSAVSYDEDRQDGTNISEFLPKLGVRADLTDNLTIRLTYSRGFKPRLVSEQILEPTSVAGFNQFYDAINGSLFKQIGGAIELKASPNVMFGAEAVKRSWDIPVAGDVDARTEEKVYRGYAYFILPADFALAAEIVKEESESDNIFDFEHWQTTAVPITLSYFSEAGWFGSIGVEFVDHSFSNFGDGGKDRFSLVHAGVGFRLPDERGIISIEAQNLLDEPIHFQNRIVRPDVDVPPRYAPELTVRLQATFSF